MPGKEHFSWELFPLSSVDFLAFAFAFFPSQKFLLFSESAWEDKSGKIMWPFCDESSTLISSESVREATLGLYSTQKVPRHTSLNIHIYTKKKKKNHNSSSSLCFLSWPLTHPGVSLDPCLLLFAYCNNTGSWPVPLVFLPKACWY